MIASHDVEQPVICVDLVEWQEVETAHQGLATAQITGDQWQLVEQLNSREMLQIDDLRSGLRIRARSFVGRVTIGNLQVTVRPKLDGLPLMNLFRYAYGLRHLEFLPAAKYGTEFNSFQDILIYQLIAEAKEILSRGLLRQYGRIDENLASPRGRIDVNRIARQSGPARPALPCTHFPRLFDWVPNQLLLTGLRLGSRLAADMSLASSARRVAALLADRVSPIRLDQTAFYQWGRIRNRMNRVYDSSILLTRLLAEASGIALDEFNKLRLSGFMFDMNRFFQALLSRFLRENLRSHQVEDERRLKGMMAYVPGMNPQSRRDPKPRPDFAIMDGARIVNLLDAKYRDLWDKPLPRDMLYQLAVYALSHPGNRSVILYPSLQPRRESQIEIRDPLRRRGTARITLRPVDLDGLERQIRSPNTLAQQRERRRIAEWLSD